MKMLILYIDIGDWNGGHNGQYPKIIEWDLEDDHRPVYLSEGWGYGLGGDQFSLSEFHSGEWFNWLEEPRSKWAHSILTRRNAGIDSKAIGQMLLKEAENHSFNLPDNLKEILSRWGNRVNA